MTSILACVPTYKNQLTGSTLLATHALASGLRARGIEWGISAISNPSIDWVRNWFLTHWYDGLPQYTHLLMIDDDMAFMPDVVLDMLAFGEPVVGALYPKKTAMREWAVSGVAKPEIRGPFIEVEGLGCGCFLIRRDAITTMLEKMPEIIDTRPNSIDLKLFQDTGIKRFLRPFDCINDPERGMVSEDISFGRRWRMCGGKVWAATHHKMVHVGPHEWADCYATWSKEEQQRSSDEIKSRLNDAPILKENKNLRGKACKHGMFIYNPNDTFIGKSLEWYGEWAEFELDLLSKFIKPGDTVIDVGANIGTHTVAFSHMVGKDGKVFSFEAQPRLEAILAANIQLNNLGNVYWDVKAVGERGSTVKVQEIPSDDTVCNFGEYALFEGKPSLLVEMITIDSFTDGLNPSVIKIDVEGMEVDVLNGARRTIERSKPVLYFEFDEAADGEAIQKMLEDIGYVAFWSIGPFFNPMNTFKNPNNAWPSVQVLAANLIAVPWDKIGPELKGLQPYNGSEDTVRKVFERMAADYAKQAAE